MARRVDVTELALRDAHQSLMATRMAMEDMVAGLRGHRQGRLLVRRVLGRRHLRLLHPLPQRGSLGAAADLPQAACRTRACRCCCAARTCSATATTRTRGRPLRREGGRERHGRLPRLRRAQRHPQPRARHRRRAAAPASTPRARSATRVSPLHTIDALRRDGRAAGRSGLRLDLHQGHGGAAEAAAGLRHRQGHQGGLRRGHARPRPRPRHDRRHAGQPDEGDRGRRRLRRHRHQLAEPRARATTRPRAWSRCWRAPAYDDAARQGAAAEDQGALRQDPPALRRVPVEHSSASRPRSSTARSPAA